MQAAKSEYDAIKDDMLDSTSSTQAPASYEKVVTYSDELYKDIDKNKSLLDEINGNLNYTMMAMCIWVPLGAIAGYYLYKKNAVPQPAV